MSTLQRCEGSLETLIGTDGVAADAFGVPDLPRESRMLFGGALWIFDAKEAGDCAAASGFSDFAAKWSTAPMPFATDAFGDLWVLGAHGEVLRVNSEVFEPVHRYADLSSWAEEILTDEENETGAEILARWEAENGCLPVMHRLMPKIPVVLGGGCDLDNLFAMPITEMLAARQEMAIQLRDMADGVNVWIDTEDA